MMSSNIGLYVVIINSNEVCVHIFVLFLFKHASVSLLITCGLGGGIRWCIVTSSQERSAPGCVDPAKRQASVKSTGSPLLTLHVKI